jgi:DMSO reductase anchor subunit
VKPAFSVIFFTTLSGLGYGMAFWMALAFAFDPAVAASPWLGGVGLGFALVAIVTGLMSSTLHLGRPERAWRAMSQWRSSWLSREGVAAVLSLPALSLLWLGWVMGLDGGLWTALALVGAILSVLTVGCTGMIYQSLKPIAAWTSKLTTPIYLLYAALTGAFATSALTGWFGLSADWRLVVGLVLAAAVGGAKAAYWKRARTAFASTPESATGLGRIGQVRQLEAPHATENYITREMGFRIARKHADKLRMSAIILGMAVPVLLVVFALLIPGTGAFWLTLAALLALVGAIVERWLFFAEAKHAVMSFYGQR